MKYLMFLCNTGIKIYISLKKKKNQQKIHKKQVLNLILIHKALEKECEKYHEKIFYMLKCKYRKKTFK